MKFFKEALMAVLTVLLLSACQKEVLTPEFNDIRTGVVIPAEGGRYTVAVSYVPTKATEYSAFTYRLSIDGEALFTETVTSPDQLENGAVSFEVPANDTYSSREVVLFVNVDSWKRVFEAVQAGKEHDRAVFDIVKDMNVGWNLGNTLDSYGDWIAQYGDGSTASYETAWGQPVTTPQLIQTFADAGFGAIRVPVTWTQHTDATTYVVDEKWIARVEEVVNYVLDAGMYCILNVHHDTGTEGWMHAKESVYNATKARFSKLWTQIASRFEKYGDHLLFESYNELLYDNTWNTPPASAYTYANSYNQDFVDAVRATGGRNASRYLVVNTYSADPGETTLKAFELPKDSIDDHLIVEVHSYAPYVFAYDLAEDPYWGPYNKAVFDAECRKEISSILDRLGRFSQENGVPVIIGEYGAADKNNEEERAKHAAWYVSNARKLGITCFHWMGLIDGKDRETCTWTNPVLKDAILNPEKYL